MVTSCVGILLNERKKEERIEVIGRQDISSYRMILKSREDTGN